MGLHESHDLMHREENISEINKVCVMWRNILNRYCSQENTYPVYKEIVNLNPQIKAKRK